MTKTIKEDKALYFSSDYTGPINPVDLEKISPSEKLHIKNIVEANVKSVLDLGCGAGGILLACQNAGVEEIHGIDASPNAIDMIKKRFEEFGTLENTSFTMGDIIEFDPPVVDAVSCHMVLNTHPNAIGIVKKATQKKPKMVVITFPKDKFLIKSFMVLLNMGMWVAGRIDKSMRGLKGFIHATESVKSTFEENGYELVFTDDSSFFTQTLIYEKSI